MSITFNTDTQIEEYFVGAKKILTHNVKTGEIEYYSLPINHVLIYGAFTTGRKISSIGYFSTEAVATEAAKNNKSHHGVGEVFPFYGIEITNHGHTSVYVLSEKDPIDLDNQKVKADEILRRKTIESLTSEQRRVLGL